MSQKKNTDMIEKKNTEIQFNHKYFSVSFIEFLDIVYNKSISIDLNDLDVTIKKNVKMIKEHTKLIQVCLELKKGFSEKYDDFDQGRIIKKIYKVLTKHIDKIYPDRLAQPIFYKAPILYLRHEVVKSKQ